MRFKGSILVMVKLISVFMAIIIERINFILASSEMKEDISQNIPRYSS